MCNSKCCSTFNPFHPENNLIVLPTDLVYISPTSAPALEFCSVSFLLEHLLLSCILPFLSWALQCWRPLVHGHDISSLKHRPHPSLCPESFPQGTMVLAGEQGKYFCGCIRVFLAPTFPVGAGSLCAAGASPASHNVLSSALCFPIAPQTFLRGACPVPDPEELLSLCA